MHTLILLLHILACIFLVTSVLFQVGKGASVGSSMGGGSSSQAFFGSAGPATFLTKITAACAIIFMLSALYLSYLSAGGASTSSIMSSVPTVKETPVSTEAQGEIPATEETVEVPAAPTEPIEAQAVPVSKEAK